jgi:hypothetical protein
MKTAILWLCLTGLLLTGNAWGNLTGKWSCNDGGSYYLRQTGSSIVWYGESAADRPEWANVFSGRIYQGRITGSWADVPKGRSTGAGDLELVVEKSGTALRVVKKSGGFVGTRWTRSAANTIGRRTVSPLRPSGDQDCVRFNPATAALKLVDGRWKIVDGGQWLFDFASDRSAAGRALRLIQHYRMDRVCFIGRPEPAFTYMLAKGGIPSGGIPGDDCVAFDPDRIRVSNVQNRWKIVDGRRWLFDFGKGEADARQALAAIRRHGFSHTCYVGRPDPGFTYLRR